MQPFRLDPAMPVTSYQTYSIAAPTETHWRRASCAEVECSHHRHGWWTTVDEKTDLGQRQAHYIRHDRTRKHVEHRTEVEGMTRFEFEAGQTCFTEHQMPNGRPELFLVRDGDWRGNPTGRVRRHVDQQGWVDDFGEHQEVLADRLKQG